MGFLWIDYLKRDENALADFKLFLAQGRNGVLNQLARLDSTEDIRKLQGKVQTLDELRDLLTAEEREAIEDAKRKRELRERSYPESD